jgi:hypothetical protein
VHLYKNGKQISKEFDKISHRRRDI